MEKMLILLKPDGMVRRYSGARALKSILELGVDIKFFQVLKPKKEFLADRHYVEHKGKFFYDNLVNFMSSTELAVIIASGDNVVEKVRTLLGKTMCEKADPLSIRGRYGTTKGINLVHAAIVYSTDYGSKINVSYVDPGYSGTLFGLFIIIFFYFSMDFILLNF